MRSSELGWTLWSFGDDTEFAELTHHEAFGSTELPSSFADAPGLGIGDRHASPSTAGATTEPQ